MQTRSGRLILNVIYSALAWILPATLGLVVTPYLLNRLGVEAYGLYLVILGFIAYAFTFSVNRAVVKYVAEFSTTGDVAKANSVITSAFLLSLALGAGGMIIVALLSDWVVSDVLQITAELQRTATVALMYGGASIPFLLVGQVFQSVLQGKHRFRVLSVISNTNWLLLNGGNVTLASLGYGVNTLLMWTVAVAAAIAIVSYSLFRRLEPAFHLEFRSASRTFWLVSSYGFSVTLYQLFGSLLNLFERAWLTRNFGTEAASYYLVPMTLALYFHAIMASLTAAIFPVMNELLDDRQRAIELYAKMSKVLTAASVLFILSVLLGGRAFLGLWINEAFAGNSYPMLVIHAGAFGLIVILISTWQLNEAYHSPKVNALIAGIWALVSIAAMIIIPNEWGSAGTAAGRLIGVAITLPMISFAERRAFGSAQACFWRSTAARIGLASVVLAAIEYPAFNYFQLSWAGLILISAIGSIAYFLTLYWSGLFTPEEKAIVLRTLGFGKAAVQ